MSCLESKLEVFINTRLVPFAEPDAEDVKASKNIHAAFAVEGKQPMIVVVDDSIDHGWDEALYMAFTGAPLPTGDPAWLDTSLGLLAGKLTPENLATRILERNPNLVITDLRLRGDEDAELPVREMSGARLVQIIRERAPALPILMMTASNKLWTYQEAFTLGVDGYWMKDGLGDHSTPAGASKNTARLLRQVLVLLGKDYQLLRRLDEQIAEMRRDWSSGDRAPWWKNTKWPMPSPVLGVFDGHYPPDPPQQTAPDPDQVFGILRNIVQVFREYLRQFSLQYGAEALYGGTVAEKTFAADFWVRSLMMHVGRLVEAVHCFEGLRAMDPQLGRLRSYASAGTIGGYPVHRDRRLQKMRRDWFGQALYENRNTAVHFNPERPQFTHADLRRVLAGVIAWLTVRPACPEVIPVSIGEDRRSTRWFSAEQLLDLS